MFEWCLARSRQDEAMRWEKMTLRNEIYENMTIEILKEVNKSSDLIVVHQNRERRETRNRESEKEWDIVRIVDDPWNYDHDQKRGDFGKRERKPDDEMRWERIRKMVKERESEMSLSKRELFLFLLGGREQWHWSTRLHFSALLSSSQTFVFFIDSVVWSNDKVEVTWYDFTSYFLSALNGNAQTLTCRFRRTLLMLTMVGEWRWSRRSRISR